MKRRFLSAAVRTSIAALAAAALVAACGHDAQTPPPAREITDATVSVLDGMSLKDYPGPKAQIVYADGEPDFFCDTLGLFSVYLRPSTTARSARCTCRTWARPTGSTRSATGSTRSARST
ncbi:hypothetical protein BMMON2_26620 [Burkholderia mallei]